MIEIRIVLNEENGQVSVQAPLNAMQAYGLLELAKDAIRARTQQQQKIAAPIPRDIALLGGQRNGR